jgi:transcriptional regulator with XRE-family HTH domain|nr:helix-turn-helix transcriptional regulator [Rhodoblastus sp.]
MITKNTIDQHVGARLRSLRENRGMTAESLATTIGIPASRLADLEEGRERIAANLMRPLARALGAVPADFFEGFSVTARGVVRLSSDDARAADEEARLTRDFALIRDNDARQLILALVSSYAAFGELAKV